MKAPAYLCATLPLLVVLACSGADPEPTEGAQASDTTALELGAAGTACTHGGMGNANGVCSSDLGFFEAAKAGCVGHGHLTTFTPNEKCGLGSSSSAMFSCCPTAPKGCVSGGAGNANGVCSTNESMFASAEESCKQLHLDVTAFSADDKCGKDSSNSFTFTCCP